MSESETEEEPAKVIIITTMSFKLSERQVKNLFKKVTESTSKGAVQAVFVKYFPGVFDEKKKSSGSRKSSPTEKKTKTTKAKAAPKSKTKATARSTNPGYRIIWVSSEREFPSSKYKKDTPIEAAESAMNGIIRKNKLKKADVSFTFIIQEADGPKYTYTLKGGELNRKGRTSSTPIKEKESSSWFG
jgi:hypothetical protein